MVEIKTNELKTRKKQVIDGHEYTVRRMGNIEQLNMAQYVQRLQELEEVEKQNKDKPLSKAHIQEVADLSKKLDMMFVNLFDDGGDQSKSLALVSSLTDTEIGLLLGQIFGSDDGQAKA